MDSAFLGKGAWRFWLKDEYRKDNGNIKEAASSITHPAPDREAEFPAFVVIGITWV